VSVPATTLSGLLDRVGSPSVDFMSLDLEGYEAAALRGLDLERHRPALLLVEISRDRQAIDDLLDGSYEPIAELSDHRSETPPWYDVLYRARP
jgi:hypothetical protein